MFHFLLFNESYKNHLSARQIRLLKARILEMTAYDSCLTGSLLPVKRQAFESTALRAWEKKLVPGRG
jgi:hypothetical protein